MTEHLDQHPPNDPDRTDLEFSWLLGTLFLYGGVAVFAAAIIDNAGRLPIPMPDFWYTNRLLCTVAAITASFSGAMLIRREREVSWSPSIPGRRFGSLVLYTRENCPLCDEAKAILRQYTKWIPEVIEVDIDDDPELRDQFTNCVPVVQFDGKVRFRGRIAEPLLRRLIEGTSPDRYTAPSTGSCTTGSCGSGKCGSGKCKSGKCKSGNCGKGQCDTGACRKAG